MSEKIITKEEVTSLQNNVPVEGLLYIRSYVEKPTSSGNGTYLSGTADGIGAIQFKVWAGKTFDKMKSMDFSSCVCKVSAMVNDYNDVRSIIVTSIDKYTGTDYRSTDFMIKKYNEDTLWGNLYNTLQNNCSEQACAIFNMIMEPVKERFIYEFAAINHHDNCVSGLLAHTSKVTRLAQTIKFYPIIQDAVTKDALFIGCALHDIGKVLEYKDGSISEEGKYLNHLSLGIGIILPYKEEIIRLKGKTFYDTLISVIQQHHGEYGERPKTLAAYLVHLFDVLESRLTDVSEAIESAKVDVIKCEDFYLHI